MLGIRGVVLHDLGINPLLTPGLPTVAYCPCDTHSIQTLLRACEAKGETRKHSPTIMN